MNTHVDPGARPKSSAAIGLASGVIGPRNATGAREVGLGMNTDDVPMGPTTAADADSFAALVSESVDSGEFAVGMVIERDVVAELVLAYVKHRAGPAADGCRVMCPAPCVVLMRHVPKADAE